MPRIRTLAGLTVAGLLAVMPAAARPAFGSLEIGPIRVQMIGPERTATLNIRNADTTPTSVQIRTVDWTQTDGVDAYSPSAQLLASPPLVTLVPGESQVVRLVVENMPDAPTERAFRLIIDEIPRPREAVATGVQSAIRALIPVFVTPSNEARPRLRWTATRSGEQVILTAFNDGDASERLLGLRVSSSGQAVGAGELGGYVLSGGHRSWPVSGAAQASSLALSAEGEYGAIEANVPVTP